MKQKQLITKFISTISLFSLCACACDCAEPKKEYTGELYEAQWDSLVNYQAPEWYEDAKLGFWVHWGVYSVPAFKGSHAAEWYGRWMYSKEGQSRRNNQGLATHNHHKEKYGDPAEFGYKDFIPMFKAEKFDADKWAELCVRGGAKFFTMMATHHDTFLLWDSKLSKFNTVNMGPKRDVMAEIKTALDKKGLKFGVSNHSAWNYCFFMWNHINKYDAVNKEYQDLYGNPEIKEGAEKLKCPPPDGNDDRTWEFMSRAYAHPSQRDLSRWIARSEELVDMYNPDLYYFDWGINHKAFEPLRREFASHYYNSALTEGKGDFGDPNVVINYKNYATFKKGSGVQDLERSGMDHISDIVWQTDDCVYAGNNWGFAEGEPIKEVNVIVDQFMDIISKKGVLMLSFAPRADGTFPQDQIDFMEKLGDWLAVCGEAVYATRPYKVLGEVSQNWGARDEVGHKTYNGTKEDVRYTRSKDYKTLYATLLDWAGDSIELKTLADLDANNIESIQLVGVNKDLKWSQTPAGLKIQLGEKPSYDYAYPIRIKFKTPLSI